MLKNLTYQKKVLNQNRVFENIRASSFINGHKCKCIGNVLLFTSDFLCWVEMELHRLLDQLKGNSIGISSLNELNVCQLESLQPLKIKLNKD